MENNFTVYDITECYGKFDPLAKAKEKGIHSLTDKELIALIIGSGTKGCSVERIASDVDNLYKAKDYNLVTVEDLIGMRGIGEVKAYQMVASKVYNERRNQTKKIKVKTPTDVTALLSKYIKEEQEHLILFTLNGAHEVINEYVVTIGLVNMTVVAPREIFKRAVRDNATAIIIGHNHPSGNTTPSEEDKAITKRLVQSGLLMGIQLVDHIIIGESGYTSFKEERLM